jgi:ABC-2 type transport system permease protein
MEIKQAQNRKKYKIQLYKELIILISIIILVNYISSHLFFRIDLTSEKRYTLSNTTKEVLKKLKDIVYVKVYLDGELPYGFLRLKKSIKETLDEFRSYSGDNIQYDFIDPYDTKDKKSLKEIQKQLYKMGLTPTNIQEKDKDGKIVQRIVFPGAIVSYAGKEVAVDFLKNNINRTPEENLNASIEGVEYSLIQGIRKLNNDFGHKIAFIEGHGELDEWEVADLTNSLSEYYTVERVRIDSQLNSLSTRIIDSLNQKITVKNKYDLIIIADPDSAFSEYDKYILDQYIMYGGKVIWIIDVVNVEMDSLAYHSSVIGTIKNLNLSDQLFKYGARVNPNLVQDVQCAIIPVNTAIAGTQPQFTPSPWIYFPLLMPNPAHPICKNINLVKGQFVSSVDPVGEDSLIKKTILLTTSENSRVLLAPVKVSLKIINNKINPEYFTKSYIPTAILLEGRFKSLYQNRLAPEMYIHKEIAFKEESIYTQMAVIGDGDIARNHVRRLGLNRSPLPLGYDRYTGQTFGNKEFLMNLISYMLDSKNFTELHSKVIPLRLLKKQFVEDNKTTIQLINILIPIILLITIGIGITYYRKRKYSKTK